MKKLTSKQNPFAGFEQFALTNEQTALVMGGEPRDRGVTCSDPATGKVMFVGETGSAQAATGSAKFLAKYPNGNCQPFIY